MNVCKNEHGPDPHNKLHPYFPDNTIAQCRRDVRKVLRHFPTGAIKALRGELARGAVNGSRSESDLLGTMARIISRANTNARATRPDLYARIRRKPTLDNDFEYWFFQVSGVSHLGRRAVSYRCRFTEITIEWCREILGERRQKSGAR